ncbi:MAG TPA: hypothetical protein VLA46_13780 [Saprospiraceae bacterium]|nr:hypothetical protein [Saprospiraceae bacterium]
MNISFLLYVTWYSAGSQLAGLEHQDFTFLRHGKSFDYLPWLCMPSTEILTPGL